MGIALPWEQAVRDHNANQPADVIVHFVRLCCAPLLKGPSRRLISWWHMHADPRSKSSSGRTLPAFFGNNCRKNGGFRERRGFESLPRASIAIKLPPFFFSSNTNCRSCGLHDRTHVLRYCCREFTYLTEILMTGVSEFLQIFPGRQPRCSIKKKSAEIFEERNLRAKISASSLIYLIYYRKIWILYSRNRNANKISRPEIKSRFQVYIFYLSRRER